MLDKTKEPWPPVNYTEEFDRRQKRLLHLRRNPDEWTGAKEYYRTHPIKFIRHWGIVREPRDAAGDNSMTTLPFAPFRRQVDLIKFLFNLIRTRENGLIEKSRDMGATWVGVLVSVWLFLYLPGATVGWGSRESDLVDRIGDPDSIFEKLRIVLRSLPIEFMPAGFSLRDDMSFMRIINPETGATIVGDVGDNIGRGGRSLVYFKDESGHYQHPEMIEAALSENAAVQVDISSVSGPGTVFHRKRENGVEYVEGVELPKGRTRVLVMDWSDHPGKTQEWYDLKRAEFERNGLLHVFAREVDRDYSAAVEGVIIPGIWVRAAIDAHIKLGFGDDGSHVAGLDVADEGGDTNALVVRKGVVLKSAVEWGARDPGVTARHAIVSCKDLGKVELQYDSIGIGTNVKSEANRLADERLWPKTITLVPWNAGAGVLNPDDRVIPHDKNSPINFDFYANLKAQGWWQLRRRFENTYRAINDPEFTWDADDLISLPSTLPLLRKIEKELSQPTVTYSSKMKLMIDKQPEGTKSPNIADAIMMAYWPIKSKKLPLITGETLQRARMITGNPALRRRFTR